jgi:hypothetical protein
MGFRLFDFIARHTDHTRLPHDQRIVILTFPLVGDEFVFLMLPHQFLDVQRSCAEHESPTVTPVLVVVSIVLDVKARPRQREANGKQAFKFRRLKLQIRHSVEFIPKCIHRSHFFPLSK